MQLSLDKILGEVICSFDMDMIENAAEKYDVIAKGKNVKIKRKRSLASIAGFPPLYYFKGSFEQVDGHTKVAGRILMAPIPKAFLIIWWVLLIFALLVSVVMAVGLVIKFMFFSPENVQFQLARVGFFLGFAFMLGIFGIIVTGVIKAISKKQRGQLINLLTEE